MRTIVEIGEQELTALDELAKSEKRSRAALIREVHEETGLHVTGPMRFLGASNHRDGRGDPARTWFVETDAPAGAPDTWEHRVEGGGEDRDLVFLCRFERDPALDPVQACPRCR